MIHIRIYRASDAPLLWEVYYTAIHHTASADYTPEQIAAWAPERFDPELWANRLAELSPFVAELEGTLAGYADVQPSGYIDHFFVAGAFNRQGVGSPPNCSAIDARPFNEARRAATTVHAPTTPPS